AARQVQYSAEDPSGVFLLVLPPEFFSPAPSGPTPPEFSSALRCAPPTIGTSVASKSWSGLQCQLRQSASPTCNDGELIRFPPIHLSSARAARPTTPQQRKWSPSFCLHCARRRSAELHQEFGTHAPCLRHHS